MHIILYTYFRVPCLEVILHKYIQNSIQQSCFIKPQVVHLCINHSLAHFLYVRALNIFFCYRIISKILQMCTREYLEDKFPEVELLGQEIKS